MKNKTKGFSLVELLVASVLGVIILTVIIGYYLSSKRNTLLSDADAALQENARAAVSILEEGIRTAGFMGCAKLNDNFPLHNTTNIKFTADNVMGGYHAVTGGWRPVLPEDLKAKVKPGTDVLVIQKADQLVDLTEDMIDLRHMTAAANLKVGDVVLISDCQQADLLTVAQIRQQGDKQIISSEKSLSHRYSKYATLSPFVSETYYIADSQRKNNLGQAIYSLYAKHNGQELVPGVENMQITYGVYSKSQGKISSYQTADGVRNWQNIHSVHIVLLSDSVNAIPGLRQQYRFKGKNQTAHDGLLRKEWHSYVALRNRN